MANLRAGLVGLVALALLSALLILAVALLLRAAPPPRVPPRWHVPVASPTIRWSVAPTGGA